MELSGRPLVNPSTDGAYFVNRRQELDLIRKSVEMRTNVLLLGARGSGRTSLLRFAAHEVEATGKRSVFVEGALATSALELLMLLRYRIAPNVQVSGVLEQANAAAAAFRLAASGGTVRRSLSGVPGESELLLEVVRDLARHLSRREREHVAFVDEAPSAEIAHTLFGRLRDDLWQLPLVWVVAGNVGDRATYTRPPADAFFPRIVTLGPLDDQAAAQLLRARAPRSVLPDKAVRTIVKESEGIPRRLVQLANEAVLAGGDAEAVTSASAARQRVVESLGEPAQRLAAELASHGPASASDETLLKRLGWSRGRVAQVLRELSDAGVVNGTIERTTGGRPRKVYALVDD